METLIAVLVLALGLVLLWTGRRRFEFNSFQATLLSILEFASFVISVIALGWLGIAILVGVNIVAMVAWSAILAGKKQALLVDASVQSVDMTPEEADEIWHWMKGQKAFAILRPLDRCRLIGALAGLARGPREIRPMAKAIALLAVVFDCDPIRLAPRFDQVLRLYGKAASDSEEVADTFVTATKNSAATFEDMLTAMIVAGDGSVEEDDTAQAA